MSRIYMTADVDLYVDQATGSDANPGTAALPFQTLERAYKYDQQNFDHAGQWVTTCHIVGNYTANSTMSGALVGSVGPSSFVFKGTGRWGVTVTAPTNGYCFVAAQEAQFRVEQVYIVPGPSGGGLLADCGVIRADDIGFITNGANSLGNVAAPRSQLAMGNFGLAGAGGNVNICFVSEDHGQINLGGQCDIAGAPTWNTAFVQSDLGGMIDATGFTYINGFPTGVRYNAISNGIVFTGTGSGPATFFPGSAAGAVNTGGQYL